MLTHFLAALVVTSPAQSANSSRLFAAQVQAFQILRDQQGYRPVSNSDATVQLAAQAAAESVSADMATVREAALWAPPEGPRYHIAMTTTDGRVWTVTVDIIANQFVVSDMTQVGGPTAPAPAAPAEEPAPSEEDSGD